MNKKVWLTGLIACLILASVYLFYPLSPKEQRYVDLVVQMMELDRPYHLLKNAVASGDLTRSQVKHAQRMMESAHRSARSQAQMLVNYSPNLFSQMRTELALIGVGKVDYKESDVEVKAVPSHPLNEPLELQEAESIAIETMQEYTVGEGEITLLASVTAHQNETFIRGLSGYSGEENNIHMIFLQGKFEMHVNEQEKVIYPYAQLIVNPITGKVNSRAISPTPYLEDYDLLHEIKLNDDSINIYGNAP